MTNLPPDNDRHAESGTNRQESTAAHVHEWEPGGTVETGPHHHRYLMGGSIDYMSTFQVLVCKCGEVKREHVGNREVGLG